MFYVVGGIYSDTSFEKIADGHTEQRYGPFETYKEAYLTWLKYSWLNVDDAHARFAIVKESLPYIDQGF